MKKRGKKINVRSRDKLAFAHAIAGVNPVNEDQWTKLGVCYRVAFEQLINGKAEKYHFNVLVDTSNIALMLTKKHFGLKHAPEIQRSQAEIARIYTKRNSENPDAISQESIEIIGNMLNIHDAQLRSITQSELRLAVKDVLKYLDNGNYHKPSQLMNATA